MKQRYTQASKANRPCWHKGKGSKAQSPARKKRKHLHHPIPKTFGEQIIRLQMVFSKEFTYGIPRFKIIRHSAGATF